MKNHEIWALCRKGQVDLDAIGSYSATVDLRPICIAHHNAVLLRDYIASLQVLANEFERTHEENTLWVPVIEPSSHLITVKTILVNPPNINLVKAVEIVVPPTPPPSTETSIEVNSDTQAEVIATSPSATEVIICASPDADADNKTNSEIRQECSHLPVAPELNSGAINAINPAYVSVIATDPPNYFHQLGLGLVRQFPPDERDASLRAAHNILLDYYRGDITTFQQVDNLIKNSPIPEITRSTVNNASSKWHPLVTPIGVLHWPTPGGIQHKLPYEDSVGLIVRVHSLDELNGNSLSSRVSIIRVPKINNVNLIDESVRKSDRTLHVDVVNADLMALLSLSWSLNVSLNIAVSVSRSIKKGGDASFSVISAFSLDRNNLSENRPRNLTEELFQQPDNVELWNAE